MSDTTQESTQWSEVEERLLDQVFYAWPAEKVRASEDLTRDGLVDSLTVVAVLEVLVDARGEDSLLDTSTAEDFRSLATIRSLFDQP